MRVMVTGATGFIGGHTLRALVDAGHTPVALVRNPAKLAEVESLHGLPPVAHVTGEITDRAAVDKALVGADACIHIAAVTALKASEADAIASNNEVGGRVVLDAAVAAGCDPIIHLSTVSAIFPPKVPFSPRTTRSRVPRGHTAAPKRPSTGTRDRCKTKAHRSWSSIRGASSARPMPE